MSLILGIGGAFQLTTPPAHNNSSGTTDQVAFDSQGNLYICTAPNTWAKYDNVAFGPTGATDSQPLGMP